MRRVSSDAEQHRDHQRGLDHRQGDSNELLPGGRAVDLGRLVDLSGNGLQTGQDQQPDERCGLPDVGDDDRPEGGPGVVHQRICGPRIRFITPASSKIHFHSSAETTVGIAHGTRMLARTMPRPRSALCMISAMATPRTVSRRTQTMVKNVVLQNAFQKRSGRRPASPEKIAV